MPTKQNYMTWYLVGHFTYFVSAGMWLVVAPWLLTIFFELPARDVGFLQSLMLAPTMIFILSGGLVAECANLRRYVLRLYLALSLISFWALVVSSAVMPCLGFIVVYGLATATISSYLIPARDNLLVRLLSLDETTSTQHAVAQATSAQYFGNMVGMVAGGLFVDLGLGMTFFVMALLHGVSFFSVAKLPRTPLQPASVCRGFVPSRKSFQHVSGIIQGFQYAYASKPIRSVMFFLFLGSLIFNGALLVLMPLIVREVYQGTSTMISLLFVSFFGGVGIASTYLAHSVPLRFSGKFMVISFVWGAVSTLAFWGSVPLWVVFAASVSWGMVYGGMVSLGRTIVQSTMPSSLGGRILGVFQFSLLASGPISSLAVGSVIEVFGLPIASLGPCIATLVVTAFVLLFTDIWQIESQADKEHLS